MSIVIEQDFEWDDGSGLGSLMDVFWTKGHGHDPREFIRAVVEHCLDEDRDIPRISVYDDMPVEMWQQNVAHNESVEFRRTIGPPPARSPKFPVTVLDLTGPRKGGAKGCAVTGCGEAWGAGVPFQALVEPTDGSDYMGAYLWLCREHSKRFPEPSYRVCMIPVGATVVLDAPKESA